MCFYSFKYFYRVNLSKFNFIRLYAYKSLAKARAKDILENNTKRRKIEEGRLYKFQLLIVVNYIDYLILFLGSHDWNDKSVINCLLNNDCLVNIFTFLPVRDRIKIERVCQRWHDLSRLSWSSFNKLDLLQIKEHKLFDAGYVNYDAD